MSYLSMALIFAGLIFFSGSVLGLLRFPDFYCRMHAAGKGDTLSALLIMTGVAAHVLQHPDLHGILLALKIMMICGAIFLAGPTMTHALMNAGFESGAKSWKHEDEP